MPQNTRGVSRISTGTEAAAAVAGAASTPHYFAGSPGIFKGVR